MDEVVGTDKKGKDKKKKRERTQTGTGRALATHAEGLFDELCAHRRKLELFYHGLREHQRTGYCMWVDYSSRMFLVNMFHTQSGAKLDPER